MFGNGTGARNKALAGAGVADQNDATAMSINPAGMVNSDTQATISGSLFSPLRSYTTNGTVFVPDAGKVESDTNYFIIPNLAYVYRMDANSAFGLSMYGNGGMNTDYNDSNTFLAGNTGADLTQIFLSAGYAQKMGNFSWGVAPIVGVTLFEAVGLGAFAGFSSDATSLTGNDHDIAVGIGARGGVELALTPNFRVAAAGSTRIFYQKLTDYSGLFEDGGSLDVPATVQAGVALDVTPNLTIMADYKHIFYSSVGAIGNTSTDVAAGSLGTSGGQGFGWNDINIYKIGFEWDVNPGLTLRAGYSYNDQPVQSKEVMFNILAPAVVQHHITGGAKMKISDSMDLEFSAMYAPEGSVKGPELAQVGGGAIADAIELNMHQWEATAGIVWHLGTPEAPL
ncbi:MAG: hydrocarbon degradation protein [bacterium]|nr:hydrocarbon degradation protein [bacterium]